MVPPTGPPTGAALDGEVGDYQVEIQPGGDLTELVENPLDLGLLTPANQ